jgi:hypothetical protein
MDKPQYDNTNKGTIWLATKNFTKKDGTQGESFGGDINVEGVVYWLDAYKRTVSMKDGTTKDILDLRVKPKTPKAPEGATMPDGSTIPF